MHSPQEAQMKTNKLCSILFFSSSSKITLRLVCHHPSVSDSLQSLSVPVGPGPEDAALPVILRLPHQQTGRPQHRHQPRPHLPAAPGELPDCSGQPGSAVHVSSRFTTSNNCWRDGRLRERGLPVQARYLQQWERFESDAFPVWPHQTAPCGTWTAGFKVFLQPNSPAQKYTCSIIQCKDNVFKYSSTKNTDFSLTMTETELCHLPLWTCLNTRIKLICF